MKLHVIYVCQGCGKESRNIHEINNCEANHIITSANRKLKEAGKKEVSYDAFNRYCDIKLELEKTKCLPKSRLIDKAKREFEEALDYMKEFERTHGITDTIDHYNYED